MPAVARRAFVIWIASTAQHLCTGVRHWVAAMSRHIILRTAQSGAIGTALRPRNQQVGAGLSIHGMTLVQEAQLDCGQGGLHRTQREPEAHAKRWNVSMLKHLTLAQKHSNGMARSRT